MRWFGIAVIWGFFAGCTLGFAAGKGIGPTLIVLPGALHGIHSGDLVVLALCTAGAARTTRAAQREWATRGAR